MLIHRLRCWHNIKQTMGQLFVFAEEDKKHKNICFTNKKTTYHVDLGYAVKTS